MSIKYKLASHADLPALVEVGDELFDYPIKENRAKEFLDNPRHHLWLAYDGEAIVGMASGFHYVHPDKDPQLFINEVGVIESYQNQSIARTLVIKLVDYAKSELGCKSAWVATMDSNIAAQKAFVGAGGRKEEDGVVLIEFTTSHIDQPVVRT